MTNTVFKKTVVAVALVATGIALGWGVSQWRTASSHASGTVPTSAETAKADRKVLYWYDPMSLQPTPAALEAPVDRTAKPPDRYTVTFPQAGMMAELMVRPGMTVSSGGS